MRDARRVGGRKAHVLGDAPHHSEDGVGVYVDEAGHHDLPARVDLHGARRRRRPVTSGADGDDAVDHGMNEAVGDDRLRSLARQDGGAVHYQVGHRQSRQEKVAAQRGLSRHSPPGVTGRDRDFLPDGTLPCAS